MLENLLNIDKKITIAINGWNSPFFDFIMHAASNGITWIPVFLSLLYLLYRNYSKKEFIIILLFTALLITLTDQVSFQLFKEIFHRLRPCHEAELQGLIRTYNGECGGDYGFVSSHAANYFGIAVFNIFLLFKKYKVVIPLLLLWALIISYSRIYLGVHYFGDVLCGALVGSLIAIIVFNLFLLIRRKYILKNN